jgi:hypothetical protein
MVEDLTPEHLKCDCVASCPSVHRIVIDGKPHLIVVGEHIVPQRGENMMQLCAVAKQSAVRPSGSRQRRPKRACPVSIERQDG